MQWTFNLLVAAAASTVLLATGCGSGSSAQSAGGAIAGDPQVFPANIYSGYEDGKTPFEVPVTFIGGSNVTWSVADASIVKLAPDGDGIHVTLTTLKAGTTTLTAKVGGGAYTASVTVTQYRPGSSADGDGIYRVTGRNCQQCHSKADGPDHTPTTIGRIDDPTVLNTISTGVRFDGQPIGDFHQFELSAPDQNAIVAYLRHLTPRGWPLPDVK